MILNPQSSFTLFPLEHAIQEGRYREALLMLEGLLDVVPEHAEAQHHRARLYVLMNKPLPMLEDYSRAPAPVSF